MDLETIQELILLEGIEASFEPATTELPSDRVNVPLRLENLPELLQLQIIKVPKINDSDLPGVEMVQYYVPLPVLVDDAVVDEVLRLLPAVNLASPLNGFNYDEDAQAIYFRYLLLVPEGAGKEILGPVILETLWLVFFVLDNLGADITAVATGQQKASQLLN